MKDNIMSNKSKLSNCSGGKKKNINIFKDEVKTLVGDEYSVLGEYINTNALIKMKHNVCGYEYSVTPHNFLDSGRRCPKCSKHLKMNINDVKNYILENYNNEYTLISTEYKNNHEQLEFLHNKCGTTFKSSFMNMKRKFNHCPICNKTSAWKFDEFCKKVKELEGDNYVILSEEIKRC